jgi:APA family basic amino acid/polyamine antiporter
MPGTKRSGGLSIAAAIAFAVGNMVGAGVFVLSGLVVGVAGPSAILSYLFCGIIVAFSGISYAALASIFPEDGGGYLFARRMLGSFPGFIAGWAMYISLTIATAFVLLGFGIYFNLLLGTSIDPRLFALGGIVLLAALNLRGLSEAGKFEIGLVASKIAILIGLIVVGIFHITNSDFVPFFASGTGGMIKGMTMVFFAYIGFQVVALMGGEVKQSSRNVPLATLISIVIVAFIYMGVIVALLSAQLPSYGSQSVFDASLVLFGGVGAAIVALGAVFSTLSSANANVIGASRIVMEMASERQIPGRFARLSAGGQPANSIILGAVLATALILYGNLTFVVDLTNVTTLVTMALVNVSAFLLVRREHLVPPEKTYFRIPLGVIIPTAGAVSCVLFMVTLAPLTILVGFIVLFAGSALYLMEDTPRGDEIRKEIRTLLGRPQEKIPETQDAVPRNHD